MAAPSRATRARWQLIELDAGREAIANTIASFIHPGAPGIESIEFRVINIAANGPVLMTERVDVFRLPNKSFEMQVMGTFEVRLPLW